MKRAKPSRLLATTPRGGILSGRDGPPCRSLPHAFSLSSTLVGGVVVARIAGVRPGRGSTAGERDRAGRREAGEAIRRRAGADRRRGVGPGRDDLLQRY